MSVEKLESTGSMSSASFVDDAPWAGSAGAVGCDTTKSLARDMSIVARSEAMTRLLGQANAVGPTDAPVLLTGESGTGKELVARALHRLSGRAGSFVAINCAAFPETLLEAELFGHERGAFTGANRHRTGRFQAAHRGTLFLDELGEMSAPTQAKVLRVLEDGVFEPLGTSESSKVDVRVVSATNRDLRERIASATFREDLYDRLKVVELQVPSLRNRRGDLDALIDHFLAAFAQPYPAPRLTPAAEAALLAYRYPGNVRELKNVLQRAVVLARGGDRVELEHLPPELRADDAIATGGDGPTCLAEVMREHEREHILKVLHRSRGRRGEAAAMLGISRKTLWLKLRNLGIVRSMG